jgi:hypothetical protein
VPVPLPDDGTVTSSNVPFNIRFPPAKTCAAANAVATSHALLATMSTSLLFMETWMENFFGVFYHFRGHGVNIQQRRDKISGGPLNLCKTFRKPLVSPHVRWYNI